VRAEASVADISAAMKAVRADFRGYIGIGGIITRIHELRGEDQPDEQ
jgi:hypothetical protein